MSNPEAVRAYIAAGGTWPPSRQEVCDHAHGIHLRPLVLTTWRLGDLVTGVAHIVLLRCYACGKKWRESDE